MAELRKDSLSFIETLGQSVANVSPTLTPALSVAVVAAIAGAGSWLVFIIATISLLIVGMNVGKLAKRIPAAGSFFLYVSRTMGPTMGMVSGWSMLAAYLFTAMALTVATSIFFKTMLTALGVTALPPNIALYAAVSVLVFAFAARDIRISARIGLTLEAISVAIILYVCFTVLAHHGFAIDVGQLSLKGSSLGGVGQALVLGIFSYVGFESAATLAKETKNPGKTIPKAIQWTAFLAGAFFIVTAYIITLGFGDDGAKLGASGAPLADILAGNKVLVALVYFGATISSYACALASINAFGRMLFSLGRYQFVHSSMGLVHKTHQTPYVALAVGAGLNFVLTAVGAGLVETTTYGWWATIASYGFIVVYLLCSVAAPMYLKKTGELKALDVGIGGLGAALMVYALYGSVYPVPAYPYNIFPYLFLAYMVVGALWAFFLKVKSPQTILGIKHDLEGADPAGK